MTSEQGSCGIKLVLHDDYAVGYLTAALRAGVSVTREMVNQPHYLELLGYDELPVNMEAPVAGQRYPYIQVAYNNTKFAPISLEEGRDVSTDRGFDEQRTYRFEGNYVVSVYANTILERETISDALIAVMGFDDKYRDAFRDNPYINIEPNMHTLSSPTANESWGTPWDGDTMTCYRQFKFEVRGEFHYRVTEHPVYITAIEVRNVVPQAHAMLSQESAEG